MGLSWEEQQETVVDALNGLCYGAFRYSEEGEDDGIKQKLYELWILLKKEWYIDKGDVSSAGGLYSSGYLEKFIKEMEDD